MAAPTPGQSGDVSQEEIAEIDALVQKVLDANLPEELKSKSINMLNRLKRLAKYGYFSKELNQLKNLLAGLHVSPGVRSPQMILIW